jgi:carboxyl-terminal processing protease
VRKSVKIGLIAVLSMVLLSMAFGAGCIISFGTPAANIGGPNTGLISQAWDVIARNYVEPDKLNADTLNQGAIQGMVDSIKDPYSAYLSPEDYKLTQTDLQGSFSGIGAQVTLNENNQPVIVAPLEGSPAGKAGIMTGDIILAVNGESIQGLSLTEVILKIRGPSGTSVTLTILHEGAESPVEITLIRAQISSSSVTSEHRGDIAYIKIISFNENTNKELNDALQSLDLDTATGIVLDLRSNPGGIVTTVVDVASHFIKEGIIITLVDNQGKKSSESVNPNGVFTELPIMVLVDQYSASGSEVLSGALQDYNRATIAGTKTLGKGSYDSFFELKDGSAIYLTIGRWLTPNGREIEGQGITPDVVLTQTGEDEIQWAIDYLHNAQQ